MEFHIVN